MRNRSVGPILLLIEALAFIIVAQSAGQTGSEKAHPPDISGVWSRRAARTALDGGPTRPDFLSDTKKTEPPMTPWAKAKYKEIRTSYLSGPTGYMNDPVFACMPPGVPRVYSIDFDGVMELIQLPDRVLQIFEFDHHIRQIFTDGRGHDDNQPPTWMGDSIGKWEGDTLVVDTTGFNDKTRLDRMGHPHTEALHLLERFRRIDHDTLGIDITIDDPKAYTKPWGGTLTYGLKPGWKVMEFMCQDNHTFDDFREESVKPTK